MGLSGLIRRQAIRDATRPGATRLGPDIEVRNTAGDVGMADVLITPLLRDLTGQRQQPRQLDDSTSSDLPSGRNTALPESGAIEPRCPIVLLLDTSNSMSSEYINQLIEGLATFKRKSSRERNGFSSH